MNRIILYTSDALEASGKRSHDQGSIPITRGERQPLCAVGQEVRFL